MKSSNPHSGCRQVEVAKTLDTTDPNPSKNQGGIAVVEAVGINGDTAGTLDASYYKGCGQRQGVEREIVAIPYTLKIRSGCEGGGKGPLVQEDRSATLATNNDQYLFQPVYPDTAQTLTARHDSSPQTDIGSGQNVIVQQHLFENHAQDAYGVDARNATEYPEMTGALQAGCSKSLDCNQVVRTHYIVRRLTPTECARLQGFPDTWGHPDAKDDFTDKEDIFWRKVRVVHSIVNGKPVKDYTKAQMLKWYNGLHTDSAEYKMWGNGIALPCAVDVLGRIAKEVADNGQE